MNNSYVVVFLSFRFSKTYPVHPESIMAVNDAFVDSIVASKIKLSAHSGLDCVWIDLIIFLLQFDFHQLQDKKINVVIISFKPANL